MLTESCRNFVEQKGFLEKLRSACILASTEAREDHQKKEAALNSRRLVLYKVPMQVNPKDGPAIYSENETYVLDWTIRMYEGAAEKSFEASSSRHAQTIASNTRTFEKWARSNNR